MRRIAFAIGVKDHEEFESLTAVELKERVDGYVAREKKEWYRTAWLAAKIITYLIRKRVRVSDLLPKMFPGPSITKEEARKELDGIKKRLGIK